MLGEMSLIEDLVPNTHNLKIASDPTMDDGNKNVILLQTFMAIEYGKK